jgi:hypothetical protein
VTINNPPDQNPVRDTIGRAASDSTLGQKMKNLSIIVCCTFCFLISASAQQPAPAKTEPKSSKSEIISTVTLQMAQQILEEMGLKCTNYPAEKGVEPYLIFKAEAYPVGVAVPNPYFISMNTSFTDEATPQTVNEWNSTHRFSRAFITPTKKLFLMKEIIVDGGVTRGNIEAQIGEFRDSVAQWARFVLDHAKPAP